MKQCVHLVQHYATKKISTEENNKGSINEDVRLAVPVLGTALCKKENTY
jgi:hypothetical protein